MNDPWFAHDLPIQTGGDFPSLASRRSSRSPAPGWPDGDPGDGLQPIEAITATVTNMCWLFKGY